VYIFVIEDKRIVKELGMLPSMLLCIKWLLSLLVAALGLVVSFPSLFTMANNLARSCDTYSSYSVVSNMLFVLI